MLCYYIEIHGLSALIMCTLGNNQQNLFAKTKQIIVYLVANIYCVCVMCMLCMLCELGLWLILKMEEFKYFLS